MIQHIITWHRIRKETWLSLVP